MESGRPKVHKKEDSDFLSSVGARVLSFFRRVQRAAPFSQSWHKALLLF
jgi:hypothetical protein